MNPSTIYLVSGSNRGLGLGLVTHILANRPAAFVYAGVRSPEKMSALTELSGKYPGRLEVVKLVSADVEGNQAVANIIEARHGRVDTVIANAGIGTTLATVSEVNIASLEDHFHVNVAGTIVLFQAMYGLLKKSAVPRFVPISNAGAGLGGKGITRPLGNVLYGATKAALNWATRKIHFENDWLVTFPVSPGPMDTDMYRNIISTDTIGFFKKWAEANPDIPSVETVSGSLLSIIDESTREKEGGQFVHIDGTRLPW